MPVLTFTLSFAWSLALAAPAQPEQIVVDRIVAVVNKSIILQSELDTLLEQMMQAEPVPQGKNPAQVREERRALLLESLIAEKLLDDEVRRLRVDVTDAEVDRVVQGTMKEHGLDEEKLKMALARQGLSMEEYREGLKKQLTKMKIIQLKVKGRVVVDDQAAKAALTQKALMDADAFKVRARHILAVVPPGGDAAAAKAAKQRIIDARARIEAGESFEVVAKAVSDDPASKVNGGDLGVFDRGEMVPSFEREAFRAKVGELVGPFKTEFGYHLLRVEDHVPVAHAAPDDALAKIRNDLHQAEIEVQFNNYLEELKRQAHIERRLAAPTL
jgi:peptidyl-prolyl cis-trans isomerase SurA